MTARFLLTWVLAAVGIVACCGGRPVSAAERSSLFGSSAANANRREPAADDEAADPDTAAEATKKKWFSLPKLSLPKLPARTTDPAPRTTVKSKSSDAANGKARAATTAGRAVTLKASDPVSAKQPDKSTTKPPETTLARLPEVTAVKPRASEPKNMDDQLALAHAAEVQGDLTRAETLYRAFLETHPEATLAQHRLGVLLTRRGQFDEAEKQFQAALKAAPSNVGLLSDAADSCFLQQRLPEAEALYRKALALEPTHRKACNGLGMLLAEQRQYDESLTLFRRANPEPQAQANLACMLAETGELERAAVHFNKALSLDNSLLPAARAALKPAEPQAQPTAPPQSASVGPPAQAEPAGLAISPRPSEREASAAAQRPRVGAFTQLSDLDPKLGAVAAPVANARFDEAQETKAASDAKVAKETQPAQAAAPPTRTEPALSTVKPVWRSFKSPATDR